jgi:hypothetical protein
MVVELGVQLQQLADLQSALEAASRQQQPPPSALKASRPSNSTSGGGGGGAASASRRSQKGGSSSGGGSADSTSSGLRPMWGFFGCKSKSKKQMDLSPDSPEQQQQQQGVGPHQFAKMGGPVVVVFVSEAPELLDGGLLGQLPVSMGLGLPGLEGREELLMGWLMEREAAVNVNDVEALAR